jgi:hypothetical protein
VNVVVRQQLDDAVSLDVVVLDDQQPLLVRRDVVLNAVEGMLEIFRGRRFDEVGERAMGKPVLPLLLDRQHLYWNMPGRGIQFQAVQHCPSEHVGQEDVERDGRRPVLFGERNRGLAAVGHYPLESLIAREAEQHARIVGIVVNDEERAVTLPHLLAVVGDHLLCLRDC